MVVPTFVPDLLRQAEEQRLQVLVFDYCDIDEKECIMIKGYNMQDTPVLSGCEIGNFAFKGGLVNNMGYPVRFFVQREYIEQNAIFFPEKMTYGEDTVWMVRIVLLAQRIQASSKCAYLYWHHETSTCGKLSNCYPGKTIYERCVLTAQQLLDFVTDLRVKDGVEWRSYADEIQCAAKIKYINQLPILLGRSNHKERCVFYNKYRTGDVHLTPQYMSLWTKLLLLPYIGSVFADCFAFVYKLTHRRM